MYGPVQALVNYLKKRKKSFLFISLPFSYTKMAGAEVQFYNKGRIKKIKRGHTNKGSELIHWIRDFILNIKIGWSQGRQSPVPLFVGIDNLNAAAGILLRALGKVKTVAYYVIDYTPKRFSNPLINAAYHAVDRFCVRRSDVVWNLSPRMQQVRRDQGLPSSRNQVVPVGVVLDEVRHAKRSQVKRNRLVYMGHLTKSKGVQLLISAMPHIQDKIPGAELHIIGTGPYEKVLKALIRQNSSKKSIFMRGPMNHGKLFSELPRYGVALATYTEEENSFSYWADATKPKEYLACGLPLIITRVPWIWKEVNRTRRPMGIAISYSEDELVKACIKLLGNTKFYWTCRKNALAYSKGLDWSKIYDKTFRKLPS